MKHLMGKHYIPKKLKWNSLTDFKFFLEKNTKEIIIHFDGWQLVTKTTRYTMVDSVLFISDPT